MICAYQLLVVDDDLALSSALAKRLQGAGYGVQRAASAAAALEKLDSGLVADLICTDVQMPGTMDGLDLIAAVEQRWPHIKLLVMSGRPQLSVPSFASFVRKEGGVDGVVGAIGKLLG